MHDKPWTFNPLRNQAVLCALLVATCICVSWPVAETGLYDDWSYIHTAHVLSNTGHVVFNGWATTMLGIQLLPAALFIKLFGFSFTICRLTTILVSIATTALLQRTLVRCGLHEWNASVATLCLMLSPIALPVETFFISDAWCLCAIAICLYGCVRALTTANDTAAARWIVLAALGNAIIGTTRQIGWLGVLVIVPCTLWLLRRRKKVLLSGAAAFLLGSLIVALSLHWFNSHLYSVPEHLSPHSYKYALRNPSFEIRPLLAFPLLALPILLAFVPMLRRSSFRGLLYAVVAALVLLAGVLHEAHLHVLSTWFAPIITERGSVFGPHGVFSDANWPVWGQRPAATPVALRALWTAAALFAALCWLASTTAKPRPSQQTPSPLSWTQLKYLLGPFTVAYLALLSPRASQDRLIDRYLLPLFLVALILLVRQYQDRVQPRLPAWTMALVLIVAGYSAATLQDAYSLYRAALTAANEVTASGVPRERFNGGWEYDGLSQILKGGYVHQNGVRLPGGLPVIIHQRRSGPCVINIDQWLPDVDPEYALSYQRNGCGGPTSYAPVTYWRYLPPHRVTIYVVKQDAPGPLPR